MVLGLMYSESLHSAAMQSYDLREASVWRYVSCSFVRVFSSEQVLGCIGYVEEAVGISEL